MEIKNNDIEKGVYIDVPKCFVSWNMSRKELENILHPYEFKKYSVNCYEISVVIFGGLKCRMVINYSVFGINKFSIFTEGNSNINDFYIENQKYLEKVFGEATLIKKSKGICYSAGFDVQEWIVGKRKIKHFVDDQYGEVYIEIR